LVSHVGTCGALGADTFGTFDNVMYDKGKNL